MDSWNPTEPTGQLRAKPIHFSPDPNTTQPSVSQHCHYLTHPIILPSRGRDKRDYFIFYRDSNTFLFQNTYGRKVRVTIGTAIITTSLAETYGLQPGEP